MVVLGEIANMIHYAQCSHAVVGDQNDGDLSVVPSVMIVNLRRRNIPACPCSVQKGIDDVTLFFEGMGVVNEKAKGQKTNEHEKKPFRSGATSGLQLRIMETTARLVGYHFTRYRGAAFVVG